MNSSPNENFNHYENISDTEGFIKIISHSIFLRNLV